MKTSILLVLSLLTLNLLGQIEAPTIEAANELIENKKYESAYTLLEKLDPENKKPEVAILKTEILMDYFVTSMMHQMFALKDLEEHEDIEDYRGQNGSFSMHMFAVDSILGGLIKQHPNNCNLHKTLGYFYYNAYLKYGKNWIIPEQEIVSKIKSNYTKLTSLSCDDYMSNYALGYIYLLEEKNKKSIPYFLKSIDLKDDYASCHYNLAYAYLFMDKREKALIYAKNALERYEDRQYKSDAARMVGQIYTELENEKEAITYYEKANQIDPNNYYNLKALLKVYVSNDHEFTNTITLKLYNLAPENPSIYDALDECYSLSSKEKELISFLQSQLLNAGNSKTVEGNLNFYLARMHVTSDKMTAKKYFLESKKAFEEVFKKDHSVFFIIEEGLKECESK